MKDIYDLELYKDSKEFANCIDALKGKIIGYSPDYGVYNLVAFGSGSTEAGSESTVDGVGKEPFCLDKTVDAENYFRFSFVAKHLSWLMGEVLTIADATMTNEKQLKATKDLIRDKFSSKISWIYEQSGMDEEESNLLQVPRDEVV